MILQYSKKSFKIGNCDGSSYKTTEKREREKKSTQYSKSSVYNYSFILSSSMVINCTCIFQGYILASTISKALRASGAFSSFTTSRNSDNVTFFSITRKFRRHFVGLATPLENVVIRKVQLSF